MKARSFSSPGPLSPQSTVALRGTAYFLSWWFVLLMHVTTAAFVLIAAFVHLALSVPVIHENTPALLITMTLKRVSGISYFVVTVLHCRAVFQMTSQSICARELVFCPQNPPIKKPNQTASRYPQLAFVWASLRWAFQTVLGSEGFFGIHGRFFNVAVLLRETVEIALQTYQLWSLSHSVSRVWINTFAVMSVVVNCWSVPVVHIAFRRQERTRRLAHLVADMLLDFVCGIVIPVCVMVPYLLDFDWVKRDFPPELMSNDIWFANAVAEGRQVLVTSFLDLFSSLLPQYGIYACLRLLKRLVVRSAATSLTHGRLSIVPLSHPAGPETVKREKKHRGRGLKTVSYSLGVWGCLVLALHIKTSINSQQVSVQGCRLCLRPWFVPKVPCAVVYVNCYRSGLSGTDQEISAILDQLERSVTTRLIFAHCPALTIPKEITSLYSLSGVIIHNSTLVDWPHQAAIKQATHPAFIGVIIGSSNISQIPDGLFHDQLPHATTSMIFHNCSITQVPENVGDVWATSRIHRLSFESSRLSSVPVSIGRIPLTHLMLTDNQIGELPGDLFTTLRLDTLGLSMNPLKQLPQNGGDTSALRELLVEYTNVSVLPPWASSWLQNQQPHRAKTQVTSLFGSPSESEASLALGLVSVAYEASMPSNRTLPQGPSSIDPPPVIRARSADKSRAAVDPYRNVLVVDGSSYWLCWWLVLSLHSITAVFVLCAAFVHLALSHPVIHANTPALQLSITLKRVSGFSYLLIALLHVRAVVLLVSRSIRAKQLTMKAPTVSAKPQKSPTVRDITPAQSMYRRLVAAILAMFGAVGALGINGRFFNIGVVVRELTEIAMQSYQLWQLSHSVSRVWINDFAVTTVVMNCWSIPLVHMRFHTRERAQRLMHLVVDMYLDFVCAVVIPVCVMTPYLLAFDWRTGSFPMTILSDDVWLTNAVAEGLQVLITSYADLFASLLPQYSIYSCLRILKRLVVRRAGGSTRSQTFQRPRVVVPLVPAVSDLTMRSHSSKYARERRGVKLIGVTVGFWGMCILILHTAAKLNTDQDPMCQLHVRPWLAQRIACSVLAVDCQWFNITGSDIEIADVLDRYERPLLTLVNFTSCPELTIPPVIIEFHHLSGIRIINSSLVSWTEDAAIRQSTHPRFDSLEFRSTNLSEIPPGVYHREVTLLFSVWFHNCSLDRLPEDIGEVWGYGAIHHLRLERMRLHSLPISLARIPLSFLWITDSLIEELPDGLFSNFRLVSLRLSRNAIRRLPEDIGDISALRELHVDHTNVSTLPTWVFSWLESRRSSKDVTLVSFAGSPVCETGGTLASGVAGYPEICDEADLK